MNNSDMPAYPHVDADGHAGLLGDGLSKREYFAGLAMVECYREYMAGVRNQEHPFQEFWKNGVALDAISMADALLSEMENTK